LIDETSTPFNDPCGVAKNPLAFMQWRMSKFIEEYFESIMIKLRLKRFGKKREASYRIVAMHSLSRRDGRPLEELGFYNPRTDEVRLDVPGIVRRLQQGAQPTDTVRSILTKANVFEQLKSGVQSEVTTAESAV